MDTVLLLFRTFGLRSRLDHNDILHKLRPACLGPEKRENNDPKKNEGWMVQWLLHVTKV